MTESIDTAALRSLADKAHEHIGDLCTGEARWKMTVPPRDDDSDLLLSGVANALTEVLDRLEQAEARIAKAAELHRPVKMIDGWGKSASKPDDFLICEECTDPDNNWCEWPCPTAAALDTGKVT